jgi:hypothetical protein
MKKFIFALTWAFILPLLFSCSSLDSNEEDNTTTCINPGLEDNDSIDTLASGVTVLKKGNLYYYEGDIVLTESQLYNLALYGDIVKPGTEIAQCTDLNPVTNLPRNTNSSTRAIGVYPTGYNLWAMARFTYDANLSSYQKQKIKQALLNIQAKTNVRFYNATGQPTHDDKYNIDYPYINFRYIGNKDTSDSNIGRIGGKQNINLADFAFYQPGVIEHEICHALGMMHEQTRNDRDNYVIINTSNLTKKGQDNFAKRKSNYTIRGGYDFNSVMGYSSMTSSTSMVNDTSKPMYTKKDGSLIYQGRDLSDNDRSWLNYYYLPYVARSDTYAELDTIVYNGNNERLTEEQRLQLQAQLNNGNPTPPSGGRIKNDF